MDQMNGRIAFFHKQIAAYVESLFNQSSQHHREYIKKIENVSLHGARCQSNGYETPDMIYNFFSFLSSPNLVDSSTTLLDHGQERQIKKYKLLYQLIQ